MQKQGFIRHYRYQLDTKLSPGIDDIRIITFSCRACATILSHYWDSKIKE